jgi:hypothetical protein
MPLANRIESGGDTLVVISSRNESDVFPYGFFHWWRLDANTRAFEVM